MTSQTTGRRRAWSLAQWLLFAVWVAAAVADMAHVRGGFLTAHAADLTLPAWLYIVIRSTARSSVNPASRAIATASPLIAATLIFAASTATEVSQYFWPSGIFAGTFDPFDVVSYAAGLAVCALSDMRWPIPEQRREPATLTGAPTKE